MSRLVENNAILSPYLEKMLVSYDTKKDFIPFIRSFFVNHPDCESIIKSAMKIKSLYNRDVKYAEKEYQRVVNRKKNLARISGLTYGLLSYQCRAGSDVSILYLRSLIQDLSDNRN